MSDIESKAEREFTTHARERGCLHWKWTSPGRPGVPDRILIVPSAMRTVMRPAIRFIEWKKKGGTLKDRQKRRIKELRDAGCTVEVFDDLDVAKAYLDELIQL